MWLVFLVSKDVRSLHEHRCSKFRVVKVLLLVLRNFLVVVNIFSENQVFLVLANELLDLIVMFVVSQIVSDSSLEISLSVLVVLSENKCKSDFRFVVKLFVLDKLDDFFKEIWECFKDYIFKRE